MLDFGGATTSDNGVIFLLEQQDRKLGLMKQVGKGLDRLDTHQPDKIRHLLSDMFRQRVLRP